MHALVKKWGQIREFEGCLSVQEKYEPVTRYRHCVMEAMDLEGRQVRVEASGLLSRIFQHEVDHLDGLIFVHRLGWLKKRRILKHLEKAK